MKHALALCALCALLFMPACTTTPTPAQLATLTAVAEDAAWVGCAYDLAENPAHRAHYALTQQGLAAMVKADTFTPDALRAALANLPVLTGQNGALLDGGVTLFILGTGFLPIDSAPRVKAVVTGLQTGLARALARPTGPATRAPAPPLPTPCTVPPRPVKTAKMEDRGWKMEAAAAPSLPSSILHPPSSTPPWEAAV